MIYLLLWYLLSSIIGWLSFPLAYRLLPGLRDRGYTASRALGLLVWGYFFWVLASLGVLRNNTSGLLLGLIVLVGLSAWALRSTGWEEIKSWLRANSRLVLVTEVLFLVGFAGWAAVRGANPEALGTEKPMELAFINAILNSATFPPHDPWLSGYAISYYYFGYVLVAMLAKLTGTPGSVAFNLGISLVFALCAAGAYGLVYNLLNANGKEKRNVSGETSSNFTLAALLGPLYVLIISNVEGFLHLLHTRGIFWQRDAAGVLTSGFWKWLDIKDLNVPPQEPLSWVPERFWWWWRASRVLQDYDLSGRWKEIIDEFPFFSFLLADLHPHVLVMPFTFLAMTIALNLFLGGGRGRLGWSNRQINLRWVAWAGILAVLLGISLTINGALNLSLMRIGLGILGLAGGFYILITTRSTWRQHGLATFLRDDLGEIKLGVPLDIEPANFLLAAGVLGGMAFLNTWDFPVYVALYAGAYALSRTISKRQSLHQILVDFVWMGIALGACGIILYLPFYLGFSSQVGGILPNIIYPTRGAHLWVMFAPLLVPILAFLFYLAKQGQGKTSLVQGLKLALGIIAGLGLFAYLLSFAIIFLPGIGDFYISLLGSSGSQDLIVESLRRRFLNLGGLLTLILLLALTLGRLWNLTRRESGEEKTEAETKDETASNSIPSEQRDSRHPVPAHIFTVLLILLGTLLVIAPEFFFLRDLFGWRMNTIFKFYFQAWLLWSIAAAYGSIVLWMSLRGSWGVVFRVGFTLLIMISLVYPILSLPNKATNFGRNLWTLDSTKYYAIQAPDEIAGIRWLQSAPFGTVAEAVPPEGGSYTEFGRVATFSGMPAVLGWVGHEDQWRGGGSAAGSRKGDLEHLYCTRDWAEAKAILDRYQVRYVFVGALERRTYVPSASCPTGLMELKFEQYLSPGFKQGDVTIYEYAPQTTP